ncbi:MAG: ATP-binding protein [Chloroflexota bacterium]
MGLTLVEQMARLHGGSITVNSQSGKGSSFTISLPNSQDTRTVNVNDL